MRIIKSKPISKIIEFADVIIGDISSGPLSEEAYLKRLETCLGCDKLDIKENGKKYCTACGCGEWKLAEIGGGGALDKLRHSGLKCPLGKF